MDCDILIIGGDRDLAKLRVDFAVSPGLTDELGKCAEAVAGTTLLKSLTAPFPEASFCPTGGVCSDNYKSYLALPNVICVGGSWMVSRKLIEGKQWHEISRLSEQAMSMA
ncbi:MAG: 2-keto-3-deoxy-6-phosphogluconate aldolase [Pseudohongiellaceae bacterium]|jgi:2-dehydro-3-deoxyphosphogluconate aldolase/(4S)-4-hydroxy-2-oxoglutarate aldolase